MLFDAFQILLVTAEGETWDKPQLAALCWRADTEAHGEPVELLPPPSTLRMAWAPQIRCSGRVELDSPVEPPALHTSQGKPKTYRALGEAFINMPWELQKERQGSKMEATLEDTVAGHLTSVTSTITLHSSSSTNLGQKQPNVGTPSQLLQGHADAIHLDEPFPVGRNVSHRCGVEQGTAWAECPCIMHTS